MTAKKTNKKVSGDKNKQIEDMKQDIEDLKEVVAGLKLRLVKQFGEG